MKWNVNLQIESTFRGLLEIEQCRLYYSELLSYYIFVFEL